MPSQLFVISGPSGVGKSTIVNALRKSIEDVGYSISHTSRKPRDSEKDGIEYYFVSRKTFSEMIEKGSFVEWAKVYYDYYGTSVSSLNEQMKTGLDILMDLDAQGAKNIKKHFKNSVLIYVLPPSLEILEKRLKNRGMDDESVINARMEKASNEIRNCVWHDYLIINDDLEGAIGEAQAIIMSERCRTFRKMPDVKKRFDISFT